MRYNKSTGKGKMVFKVQPNSGEMLLDVLIGRNGSDEITLLSSKKLYLFKNLKLKFTVDFQLQESESLTCILKAP